MSSSTGRKVGMSRRVQPPRLLQSIGSKNAGPKQAATTKKRSRTPERGVDVLAPPISSDEDSSEEDEPKVATGAEKGVKSSDDESDEPDRADIRPTAFQSSMESTTSTSSNRSKNKYGGSTGGPRKYGSAQSSQDSKPSSSQRSRNARGSPDELGPVNSQSMLRAPDKKFKGASTKRPTIRPPRPMKHRKVTEEPARPPSPVRIKLPEDFLFSPEGKAKGSSGLNLPAEIENTPSPERRKLRILSRSPSAPAVERKLNTRFLGHSDDELGPESKRQKPTRIALVDRSAQSRGKTDGPKKSAPGSTRLDLSLDADDSALSELSSDDDFADGKVGAAQCPYCKKPVDGDALRRFSNGEYMTLRKQRRFCTQHKEDEARAEWAAKGYPSIDWAGLDARISTHHAHLEGILLGGRSHYGDLLAREVKAGAKRNLAKSDFNNTPGYYGERGFRAMQEGVFARFSGLLRKRAVEDGLVSARGYSLYVQAVLVPELAVRLVMEDMGVGEEEARGILERSAWVGDLLCEDEGDVVDEDDENLF